MLIIKKVIILSVIGSFLSGCGETSSGTTVVNTDVMPVIEDKHNSVSEPTETESSIPDQDDTLLDDTKQPTKPDTDSGKDKTPVNLDGDNDGIVNADDACLDTPPGTTINIDGCELPQHRVRIEAEAYTNANDTTAGNEGMAAQCDYAGMNVDVGDANDIGGGCNVGWLRSGEWLEYTVTLPEAEYQLRVRAASDVANIHFSVQMDNAEIATIDAPATGDWQKWQSFNVGNAQTLGGRYTLRINIPLGSFNLNWLEFISVVPDDDKDGVIDALDNCPTTAHGQMVDAVGCSSDEDGDGVMNIIDECENTTPFERIDERGCALLDQTNVIHTMTIMIDFSDAPAKLSMDSIDLMLNGIGHTGDDYLLSIRDYWYEVSQGKADVVSHNFGYYRAPEPASYYKTQSWTEGVALIGEAFNWIKDTNPDFDWSLMSQEDDGTLLGLQAVLTTRVPGVGATHFLGGNRFTAPNGVEAGQVTSQTLWDWTFEYQDIFTFLHEQGHMLWGWPDLYNVEGSNGTGRYELMSSNNFYIGVPNGALLAQEGWVDVIDGNTPQVITLNENGAHVVRYDNPNVDGEYFLIEARNKQPLSAQRIPGAERGLFIWHIDERVNGNRGVDLSQGENYHTALVQADGQEDLENASNSGDDGDAFTTGDVFNDNSSPRARWWNNSDSGLDIGNIELLENNQIRFEIK